MPEIRLARPALLVLQAVVGVTAVVGGVALTLGELDPGLATVLSPPSEYLRGSPFTSYLVPGAVLAVVLGGIHLLAFALLLRRHRWAMLAAAVAAFDTLIWIFVQVIIIPFSVLQVVYFAAGLAEVGLLLLLLGLMRRTVPARSAEGSDLPTGRAPAVAVPSPGRARPSGGLLTGPGASAPGTDNG